MAVRKLAGHGLWLMHNDRSYRDVRGLAETAVAKVEPQDRRYRFVCLTA